MRPTLTIAALEGGQETSSVVSAVRLEYKQWQPVLQSFKRVAEVTPVRISVDSAFGSSEFEAKFFGKQNSAYFHSATAACKVPGKAAAASVSLHQQKLEYIRRHQLRHSCGVEAESAAGSKLVQHKFVSGTYIRRRKVMLQLPGSTCII